MFNDIAIILSKQTRTLLLNWFFFKCALFGYLQRNAWGLGEGYEVYSGQNVLKELQL